MEERLEFRLTDLEAARSRQVADAFRREFLLRYWWLPAIPAIGLILYMVIRYDRILPIPMAILGGGLSVYWASLQTGWGHGRKRDRLGERGTKFRLRERGVEQWTITQSGLSGGGSSARLTRWESFDAARVTPQWIELWKLPRLTLLPRRGFSSPDAYHAACSHVRKTVRLDPELESTLPRILCLGDSYTVGESVGEDERWPVQLVNLLREREVADVAAPTIVAKTGWTTDELAAAIREAQLRGRFDLVTLLIGVNNQYRGMPIEDYREGFRELIETAIRFAGYRERVIVLSIPDWGVTPFAEGRDRESIAREIDAFNAVNLDEATKAGARYVDVTPVSREAAGDVALVAEDGLHPSGEMYRRWAELVLPQALAAAH